MSDEPENFMLVFMRRLDAKMDRMGDDIRELKARTIAVEQQLSGLSATVANHYVGTSMRLDRLETRVERIETRLELTEH